MGKEIAKQPIQDQTAEGSDVKDHLANERTFLAWIRTSLGLMAFGFVVEKFTLFLRQVAYFLNASNLAERELMTPHLQGYSSIFGISLVAFGTLMTIFAFVKFKKIEKQIQTCAFKPSSILDLLLTFSVLLIGIFLVVYLLFNNSAFVKSPRA